MRVAALPFVLVLLIAAIQLGMVTVAFERLGLSPASAYFLLWGTFIGSFVNVPLFMVRTVPNGTREPPVLFGALEPIHAPGRTIIAVNVGGAVIPVAFSGYLYWQSGLSLVQAGAAVAAVAAVAWLAYRYSRPIEGIGIGLPLLLGPVSAAFVGIVLGGGQAPSLAYIGGTVGDLIGADLLNLGRIRSMGATVASIGGAGSFDGVFLTGMLAVLLA